LWVVAVGSAYWLLVSCAVSKAEQYFRIKVDSQKAVVAFNHCWVAKRVHPGM